MNKKTIAAVTILSITIFAIAGASNIYATDGYFFGRFNLLERLSAKLGISEDVVEKALKDIHVERLEEAVKEGKISEEQKQLLIEKQEEYSKRLEDIKQLPENQQKEALRELKRDMHEWKKDNKSNLPGKHRGPWMGMWNHMQW